MAEMPNEEAVNVCADALYNALADHCMEIERRATLLHSFAEYDLGEAPGEVRELFGDLARKCLALGEAVGAES